MFNQTLSLSIAQTALPGNAEGWTILLSDPNGAWQQMFNIARANEPGYVEVMTSATRTGTVPYNSSDIIWKLKVCYISQLDSEKVRAAPSGVRPGKIPGECVVKVFKELEEQKVVFEGTARQAERGIETYKDSEWVLCASDSEEGYTTAEEGRKKKGNTK